MAEENIDELKNKVKIRPIMGLKFTTALLWVGAAMVKIRPIMGLKCLLFFNKFKVE